MINYLAKGEDIAINGWGIMMTVDKQSRYAFGFARQEIDPTKMYRVTIKEEKDSRSLQQNKMLWALIRKIAKAESGTRANKEDEERIYFDLLGKFGQVEDIACKPEAVENLKKSDNFRGLKVIGNFQGRKGLMTYVQVVIGSSKYTTEEMGQLLEGALDWCAELGIYDNEIAEIQAEYEGMN